MIGKKSARFEVDNRKSLSESGSIFDRIILWLKYGFSQNTVFHPSKDDFPRNDNVLLRTVAFMFHSSLDAAKNVVENPRGWIPTKIALYVRFCILTKNLLKIPCRNPPLSPIFTRENRRQII